MRKFTVLFLLILFLFDSGVVLGQCGYYKIKSTTHFSVCLRGNTTLTANGIESYIWVPSTNLSSTTGGTSITVSPTITTTYSVTENGCTSGIHQDTTITVFVNPIPTLTISPQDYGAYCVGGSGSSHFTASGSAGSTYAWAPSTNLSSTTGGTPITVSPTITTTYIVTETSDSGCTLTENIPVYVNPIPTLTISPQDYGAYCAGGSGSSHFTASGSAGSTYAWAPSTNLSSTTGGISVTVSPTITTTYIITETSDSGCILTKNIPVYINPIPMIISSANPDSFCFGGKSTLTASGGISYAWVPSTDLSATTGATVTANPTITSTYTVTASSDSGCTSNETLTVIVNPNPNITVTPKDTSFCYGDSSKLKVTGANSYIWTPLIALSNTTGDSSIAKPTIATTYTIIGTNTYGCKDTNSVTVIIDSLAVTPIIISLNDANFCLGQSATLRVNNPCGGCTFNWFNTEQGQLFVKDSLISVKDSGTYYATATNGCTEMTENSDSIQITVLPLPSVEITQLDDSVMPNLKSLPICNKAFGLHYAVNNPIANQLYSWSTGSLKHDTSTNSTICIILDSATYSPPDSISLQITDTKTGCINVETEQIANSNQTISPSTNPIQMFTGSPNIYICLNNQVNQYQWGSDESLSMDTPLMPRPFNGETNQSYIGDTRGKYLWVVTVSGDCWTRSYYNSPLTRSVPQATEVLNGVINILPNPSTGSFILQLSGTEIGSENIKLSNLLGEIIYEGSIIKNTTVQSIPFNFNYLSSGIYFLSINGAINGTVKISIE